MSDNKSKAYKKNKKEAKRCKSVLIAQSKKQQKKQENE